MPEGWLIVAATADDVHDLLPLLRGYADFYGARPSDDALLAMSRALVQDSARDGVQLLARRASDREMAGFATVLWTWSTLSGARIGVMNDLFVRPESRGRGLGRMLLEACVQLCEQRGDIASLRWQTAPDNSTAQRLYDSVGARRSRWLDFDLDIRPART